ncbi:hypothetical protein Nepgr_015675 [Nepenthes gracilis]|uniref:WPP domain-containing protein n=1 Tax=Nepenthes gracilis TaxID=150966 RepID=A0AAD3SN78_NEPGR|nr:hypothetical protein Nepgr_015675 [Nepenthes gracilis]
MAEIQGTTTTASSPPPEEQPQALLLKALTMAESDDSQQQRSAPSENLSQKFEKLSIPSSFSIWPPTQRTRDAVINSLIETLSQQSVLSKRYGSMPPNEAAATARALEEEAFTAASAAAGLADAASFDDGIEILHVYSKEISKRMLDAVKSRAATATTPEVSSVQSPSVVPADSTTATVSMEKV